MLLVSKLLHIPILAVNRRTWRLKKQLHWWVCVRIRHFTIRFVSTNVPVAVVMWCSSRCVKPDISQMQNVILCRLFRWNWLTIVLTIKRGWLLISVNISAASWQHRNR
jgi:PBP_1a_fam: penicillin-binding protein, 1A family